MIETIEPDTIVNYSYAPDDIFKEYIDKCTELIIIENYAITVRKAVA